MENKIVTMASRKFGTVRKIYEGDKVIFCGADVAKALGYSNARKALTDHCRCVTKRYTPHPQSNSKQIEMSFIPESDVYRLICHSKLPSAMEFEKWVFEDVVPKAVDKQLNAKPEQLTLETAEYHYFGKTYKGEPVITLDDFEYFTGISHSRLYFCIKRLCRQNEDYITLSGTEISDYKRENPSVSKLMRTVIVLKASAVRKLLDYLKLSAKIPMIEQKKERRLVKLPTDSMKSLMGYIQRETKAIEGISHLLLAPDTAENLDNYRKALSHKIKELCGYCIDIETIRI